MVRERVTDGVMVSERVMEDVPDTERVTDLEAGTDLEEDLLVEAGLGLADAVREMLSLFETEGERAVLEVVEIDNDTLPVGVVEATSTRRFPLARPTSTMRALSSK